MDYTPATQAEHNIIAIGLWKAFAIVAGAVLVAIVGTAFTVGAVLNSDHFTLVTAIDDISELKTNKQDKTVSDLRYQQLLDQNNKMYDALLRIETKLNQKGS